MSQTIVKKCPICGQPFVPSIINPSNACPKCTATAKENSGTKWIGQK